VDLNLKLPHEIYLLPEAEAWAAKRDTITGWGGKTVLGIGIPFLMTLSGPQMGSVVAHELSHFSRKDTTFGPLIYTIHQSLFRIIEQCARNSRFIDGIFILFAKLFFIATRAMARNQEITADMLASRYSGSLCAADALRQVVLVQKRFSRYWSKYYYPALMKGYILPFMEGYNRFLQNEHEIALAERLAEVPASIYSTHSPVERRIHIMESEGAEGNQQAREVRFFSGEIIPLVEDDCAAFFKQRSVQNPRLMKWEEAGEKIFRLMLLKRAVSLADGLVGLNITFPEAHALAGTRLKDYADESEIHVNEVTDTLGTLLTAVILKNGWNLIVVPERFPWVTRDGRVVKVFKLVQSMARREISSQAWVHICTESGFSMLNIKRNIELL
jgi:hypothetical protein